MKVGDKVRITIDNPCETPMHAGDVVTIERTDLGYLEVRDQYGSVWGLYPSECEPVTVATALPSNPIYSYRASEELDTDSWSTLVKAVDGLTSDDVLKEQFKSWENEYKTSTGLPIPNAWRSAKSVIVRANKHDVAITHSDGSARGKTAVENEIKSVKAGDKVVEDADSKFDKMLDTLVNFANKHSIDYRERFSEHLNANAK